MNRTVGKLAIFGLMTDDPRGVASPKQHTGVMPPMGGAQLTPAQVAAV